MTVQTVFTDPCCFHATLGTLLLDRFPGADPALVLGNSATTEAVDGPDGPVFDHIATALTDTLAARGHRLVRAPLRTASGPDALRELLDAQTPVVAVADTYALDHYWVDRGRSHALHAVLLRAFDPVDGSVRLTDPMDATLHESRTDLAALRPALFEGPLRQEMLHVAHWGRGAGPDAETARAELAGHAQALSGPSGPQLSGVGLAAALAGRVDEVLASIPLLGEVGRAEGDAPDRDRTVGLLLGLWGYHHRLRWFARYLRALSADQETAEQVTAEHATAGHATTADLVDQAGQDWLAVRTLLLRGGMSGREQTARYREEITTRLGRAGAALEQAGSRLDTTVPRKAAR